MANNHGWLEGKRTSSTCNIRQLIGKNCNPNWRKDFPVAGQGTLVFSIQRSTPFFIVVRPKLPKGETGADQWIALSIRENSAEFSIFIDGRHTILSTAEGIVKNEAVGYDAQRRVSYWLSYDRNRLVLKYGKGYRMEETTLLEHNFLAKVANEENERARLKYLFSPEIRRQIEQYDVMPLNEMIQCYASMIKTKEPHLLTSMFKDAATNPARSNADAQVLSKSLIDIEEEVMFDRNPLVYNWSPQVIDSSKMNLFELDSNDHTYSASLPSYCLELYSNVTAPDVDLDWAPTPEKYRLSDAIRYSLRPNGILYKKLKEKTGEFGSFDQTYLRVTLGVNRGCSPGIPYVLEIWPMGHGSPIHNHGNSYAVIKVLHGSLTIRIYNKHVDDVKAVELMKFDVHEGDVTWISPNWFQTHKLWNDTGDYCATIQCYQYGKNDEIEWPYFDYVASTSEIDEFRPDSDYTFHEMRRIVMKEYIDHMEGTAISKRSKAETRTR